MSYSLSKSTSPGSKGSLNPRENEHRYLHVPINLCCKMDNIQIKMSLILSKSRNELIELDSNEEKTQKGEIETAERKASLLVEILSNMEDTYSEIRDVFSELQNLKEGGIIPNPRILEIKDGESEHRGHTSLRECFEDQRKKMIDLEKRLRVLETKNSITIRTSSLLFENLEILAENYKLEHFNQGLVGLIDFLVGHFLYKDGELLYVKKKKNVFLFYDKEGVSTEDVDCAMLFQNVKKYILPKVKIIQKGQLKLTLTQDCLTVDSKELINKMKCITSKRDEIFNQKGVVTQLNNRL